MSEKLGDESPGAGRNGGGEPPQDLHLWKLPRGRHGLSRELVAQSQQERLLAAVIRVTASKGYRASSVADILREAGVGRETFYRHFKDKRDCFVAANDALLGDLEARVGEAYERPGSWPDRVRGALGTMLDWFATNPEIARVMMIEMGTVGPIAGARFHETFERFTAMLDDGDDGVERTPYLPNLAGLASAAVFAAVYEEVALGNSANLPALLPQLTFEVLLPYIGEEAAAGEREAAENEVAKASGARTATQP